MGDRKWEVVVVGGQEWSVNKVRASRVIYIMVT